MFNCKGESRPSSERLCDCEASVGVNNNRFSSHIHYKNFILKFPPIALDKDRQYEFMKSQVQNDLPFHQYNAAVKFICDVLDY